MCAAVQGTGTRQLIAAAQLCTGITSWFRNLLTWKRRRQRCAAMNTPPPDAANGGNCDALSWRVALHRWCAETRRMSRRLVPAAPLVVVIAVFVYAAGCAPESRS